MNNNATGWRRLIAALRYSAHGIRQTYRDEAAFRQEIWLLVVLLPLAFWLTSDTTERALLVFSAMLIPLVELLNTGIEKTVDLLSPDYHPSAKKAKDAASAAVFITFLAVVAVWAIVLLK